MILTSAATQIGGSLRFLLSRLSTYVTNKFKRGVHKKIQSSKYFTGDNRQLVLKLDTFPDDL